jgi:hypothetical protein
MSALDIFDTIETSVMKVLTRKPGVWMNQYVLYSNLLEELDIKDPTEKENFKIRFLIVLRKLSSVFDNVEISNIKGVLHAIFKDTDDTDDTEEIQEKSSEDNSTENYDLNMPNEIAVIRFIVDENIEKYNSKKDFDGNNILHILALHNDYERFEKMYLKDDLLFKVNNKNKTPIDLISDIRMTNLLLSDVMKECKTLKNQLKTEILEMKQINILLGLLLFILVLFIIFLYIFFIMNILT